MLPLDRDAAELLREMFLDRTGRVLVFTTHVPVSIEADAVMASAFLGRVQSITPLMRGVSIVNMSLAKHVD